MLIVHIGLGKTGTTFLQSTVFPACEILGKINYRTDLRHKIKTALHEFEISGTLPKKLHIPKNGKSGINLVSYESLAGWNPSIWHEMRDFNLSLFGQDAKIIITLRDPTSYMVSCYQQSIHRLNSWLTPSSFFVNLDSYKRHQKYFGRFGDYSRMIFSLDHFSFNDLIRFYSETFSVTYVTELSKFIDGEALKVIFKFDRDDYEKIKSIIHKEGKANKSYSSQLMYLDKKRFNILLNLRVVPLGKQFRTCYFILII